MLRLDVRNDYCRGDGTENAQVVREPTGECIWDGVKWVDEVN